MSRFFVAPHANESHLNRTAGRSGYSVAALALALFVLWGPLPASAQAPPAQDGDTAASAEEPAKDRDGEDASEARNDGEAEEDLDEIRRRIRILAEEIQRLKQGEAAVEAKESRYGLGPAASKVYGVAGGVSLGGYGEALYENFDSSREDGLPSGRSDQLDFLRAIVYVGYKFNDRILFNSELEFEHASTGKKGEVSVEFAYLDFLLRDAFNVRAGMVLVPLGFINELHEPPIFLGARRPLVENRLIPTTWRENGAGVFGEAGPFSYRAYVITSLAAVSGTSSGASGFSASGIRGGRSSGSKSAAEDFALAARLDYQPRPWLTLGASVYNGDTGHGMTTPAGDPIQANLAITDLRAEVRWKAWQARALAVRSELDDAGDVNLAQGFTGADSVGSEQRGWYAEVGYDVFTHRSRTRQSLIPYVRYESLDTQHEVPAGFMADPANDLRQLTVGVAWKPLVQIAVKADYSRVRNAARSGVDQFSLALGFLY